MVRRPGGKVMVMGVVAFLVLCVVVFEGRILSGENLRHKITNYQQLFQGCGWPASGSHSSCIQNATRVVTTARPGLQTSTDVWQHEVYSSRRHHTLNVCSRVRGGGVERLTRYGNTSYCVVPKVGCTFWINVFRYLHGDTGKKNVSSPFSIPRVVTHYGPRKRMKYFSTNTSFAPRHLATDLRFMFVRDPYSRLWSAYVDKFLLVDYWRSVGRNIVKLRPKKDNMTMCARDISFKEFVDYVASRSSPRVLNEHWKPILYLCSPCLYQPHVIGKMETFPQDSGYILNSMNASWILESYDHQQHVYQEMDMLITYNFHIIKSTSYKNCTNSTDLCRRLWKTFQINGYIPMEMGFPDPGPSGMNSSQFQTLAHDAYRNRPYKSSAQWREQREKAMANAFREVSTQTLEKIKRIYSYDFEMFGYDPEPDSIYAYRTKSVKR